jgi:hypothetical protein
MLDDWNIGRKLGEYERAAEAHDALNDANAQNE